LRQRHELLLDGTGATKHPWMRTLSLKFSPYTAGKGLVRFDNFASLQASPFGQHLTRVARLGTQLGGKNLELLARVVAGCLACRRAVSGIKWARRPDQRLTNDMQQPKRTNVVKRDRTSR